MVGLDLFGVILRIARARCPSVAWVRGDGARMPFGSGAFDYVANQFSYHHMGDKLAFVREVARVLDRRGRFVLTNVDPWSMPGWVVYQFFPAARELDHADFLPADALVGLMNAFGFRDVRVDRRHHRSLESLSDFLGYARGRHRASQFLAIPDAEYDAGIGRIERAVRAAPGPSASIESEPCLLTITGDRP